MSSVKPALPSKDIDEDPYELLTGHKPNVKYFRVFGCKCFILNKKDRLAKFQSKTIEGIFVGYASNSHAYMVYNKSTGCVVETCDVEFDEFNGSHGEQVDLSDVGHNEDSSQDIWSWALEILCPLLKSLEMMSLVMDQVFHHHKHLLLLLKIQLLMMS